MAKWRRSGLSARAYAAQEGLKASTLSWWSWKLQRDGEEEELALLPVEVLDDEGAPTAKYDEGWELVTASGDRLRGPAPLSPKLAGALVTALVKSR